MRQVFPDGLKPPCHYHSPICLIVGMIITLINFLVMTITLINVIVMSHDHHTNKRHSQDHHTDKHHSHDHHRHLEHKFLPRSWRWLGNEAFIRKTRGEQMQNARFLNGIFVMSSRLLSLCSHQLMFQMLKPGELGSHLLQTLDGFIFVLSRCSKITIVIIHTSLIITRKIMEKLLMGHYSTNLTISRSSMCRLLTFSLTY